MKRMEELLGRGSGISSAIENFEIRDQQIEMAQIVQKGIKTGGIMVIEAGCGIGKSFAYLVPFIKRAEKTPGSRVAVSTYTKTLQKQLIEKDIPLLQKALNSEVRAALCLGSENYLCLRRLASSMQLQFTRGVGESGELGRLNSWSRNSADGIRMNAGFTLSNSIWSDVCRQSDFCLERKCPHFSGCFYFAAKKQQARAGILVLNHHLLFNDIASGRTILPRYDAIVFDEAHNLEDSASDTLGLRVSMTGVKFLLSRIHHSGRPGTLLGRFRNKLPAPLIRELTEAVRESSAAADDFFSTVLEKFGTDKLTLRINSPGIFDDCLSGPLENLGEILRKSREGLTDPEAELEFKSFSARCVEKSVELRHIISTGLENYVYYLEINPGRSRIQCSLNGAPVEVSDLMRKLVFEEFSPVILSSATLAVNGSFDFINKRLGIENARTALIDSPYDYSNRALFYVPGNMPSPSSRPEQFLESVVEEAAGILEITRGRSFILFTSYSMLNSAASSLADRFPDLRFLVQGEISRGEMVREFTSGENTVLMGTSTFWQGVDFPGRLLECVIITKLPFAVPDNPVTEARIEKLKEEGADAFLEYQVPSAALIFKQGFGRLIRHRDDFGIVAVLDPRINKKRYGRIFLESLPRCATVSSIGELGARYREFIP